MRFSTTSAVLFAAGASAAPATPVDAAAAAQPTHYLFTFGDSYSQTGFNATSGLTLPTCGNAFGNPAFVSLLTCSPRVNSYLTVFAARLYHHWRRQLGRHYRAKRTRLFPGLELRVWWSYGQCFARDTLRTHRAQLHRPDPSLRPDNRQEASRLQVDVGQHRCRRLARRQ